MRIVIPGGSGQVGHVLARHFHAQGNTVTVLSRQPQSAPWSVLPWDGLTPGAWVEALEGADACINLAGRSVNCRYTAANRRAMYDSRILSTRLLNQVIASLHRPHDQVRLDVAIVGGKTHSTLIFGIRSLCIADDIVRCQ